MSDDNDKSWEQLRDFAAGGSGMFWCAGISDSQRRDANGVADETRQGPLENARSARDLELLTDELPRAAEQLGESVSRFLQQARAEQNRRVLEILRAGKRTPRRKGAKKS